MNILNYLNVIIGFSLVMLILSIVTGSITQTCLTIFKIKSKEVYKSLEKILLDIGLEKDSSELKDILNSLGLKTSLPIAVMPEEKNISREEFVLLLLKKAKLNEKLAKNLGFQNGIVNELDKLEKEMLAEETKDPSLPAQIWRTNAMQKIVPDLASKIFSRFDGAMERVAEHINAVGKLFGIAITLVLLFTCWPVDSIKLMNRLNHDQVLSQQLADAAADTVPKIEKAQKELSECIKTNPDKCDKEKEAVKQITDKMFSDNPDVFTTIDKLCPAQDSSSNKAKMPAPSPKEENNQNSCFNNINIKIAKPSLGIFVTWLLVSFGSAFWLGILNKMLGIRSELSKKLDAQRESRETQQ
jgi:hypothetical protein